MGYESCNKPFSMLKVLDLQCQSVQQNFGPPVIVPHGFYIFPRDLFDLSDVV